MATHPRNSNRLHGADKVALYVSLLSILISLGSWWESHMTRRSGERMEDIARQATKQNEHLTELLSRPWVMLSAVAFSGHGQARDGFRFAFKNAGSSPALHLNIAPCVTWDSNEVLDLKEVEKEGMIEGGTVPAGESASIIMSIPDVAGLRRSIANDIPIRYGVSWSYTDVHGNKHMGRQLGRWDKGSGMFTVDENKFE